MKRSKEVGIEEIHIIYKKKSEE